MLVAELKQERRSPHSQADVLLPVIIINKQTWSAQQGVRWSLAAADRAHTGKIMHRSWCETPDLCGLGMADFQTISELSKLFYKLL